MVVVNGTLFRFQCARWGPDMPYRTLGRTGVQVSTLVLGAMNFGSIGRTTQAEVTAIVDAALDGLAPGRDRAEERSGRCKSGGGGGDRVADMV